MSIDNELSTEEQKYFDSGGEAEPEVQEAPQEAEPTPAEAADSEAPVSEPEPVQEPENKAEPEERTEERKMVDIRALHEERANTRELKARLAQMEREHREAMQRLQSFEKQINPQQQPPQFEENPAEYLRGEVETVKKSLEQTRQQEQQTRQVEAFKSWYAAQAAEFSQKQPDFNEAYETLVRARHEELANAGLTRDQAVQRFWAEEAELARSAGQTGINPAQLIYQAAVAKGYKPKQQNTNAPIPKKLENVARGMESARPNVGGAGKLENLTPEWLEQSSDAEFLAKWDEVMAGSR